MAWSFLRGRSERHKPAAKPRKPDNAALAALLKAGLDAEYINPLGIKGQGRYVIETTQDVNVDAVQASLINLGLSKEVVSSLERYDPEVWTVQTAVMAKAVPGYEGMAQEQLMAALRKIPGHENSKVTDVDKKNGIVYLTVKNGTFRNTLLGPNPSSADKAMINKVPVRGEPHIVVPEEPLHAALGIDQAKITPGAV